MSKELFSIHNHSDVSNFATRDSTNTPEKLIDYAHSLGLPGIALTDHATISNHIRASRYVKENEHLKDFTLALGEEIYLLNKEDVEWARENNEKIKYPHFLVLAKNSHGYEFIKKLSTREWDNSFFHRGMQRRPTYYDELSEMVKGYEDDIIFSSACLGSPLSQYILDYHESQSKSDKKKIHDFITYFIDLVGKDNFYLELQPAIKHDRSNVDIKREQEIVNNMLLKLSKVYDLTPIVTTDAHYLSKEQAFAHKVYLQANSNSEREIDSFYSTTYVMNREELLEYFNEDLLDMLIENTHSIMDKIEYIEFEQETQVPTVNIPEYEDNKLFDEFLNEYKYIKKYKESSNPMDNYYLHLLGEGMNYYNQEFNSKNLSRIDLELEQIWEISNKLKQPLSSYFVLTQDIINMMWEVSLVGTARGSAACYYTNYLLGIVQINPMDYDLPYYRFLSKERAGLPDIDIDTEASKREEILELAKERYGHDKILNSCTFTTEGPKSTVITATRGYGLDVSEQHNIANLIPNEGALLWSVSDCLYGNEKEGRKPVKEFVERVEKHEGLKEIMTTIEGIISGRSQHASSVIFYPNSFLDENAMMKTTKGLEVTQFNADDGEYAGELKIDMLSISALGRIREAINLLLQDGKIEWQGSLRATYDKYFHPDVLDLTSKGMYDMLADGEIFDAFQMSSLVARNAMRKIRPETFDELTVTNTIIRLQVDSGEQPIDMFTRYKHDIDQWYKDMRKYGLNESEIKLLEKHLLTRTGICDAQELLMAILIDPDIANAGLTFANKFRKSVGKKDQKKIENASKEFYDYMKKNNHRDIFAQYILEEQFGLQFNYAFSLPHTVAYSLILLIEMNIAYHYGSIYWKTACLNAGVFNGDEMSNAKDYTSISQFVNSMKQDIIAPDINDSQLKFVTKDNKILFSLAAILGLDKKTLENIMEHRPFHSMEDFNTRMIEEKLISPKKAITLTKAGLFNNLEGNSKKAMIKLVGLVVPEKDKITMVQLPYVMSIVPDKYKHLLELYNFRDRIKGKNKEPMHDGIEEIFIENYSDDVDYLFDDGILDIDIKSFEKYYNKEIKPLKEEIKKPEYIKEFTKRKRQEFWIENCLGTQAEWEIETLLFNTEDFVINVEEVEKTHAISDFNELENLPYLSTNKYGFNEYEISAIVGTVVGYENPKKLVYVLTQNSGVVTAKLSKKNYARYQETTDTENSWFERGTNLVLLGYKNGESFQVKGNNIYRNPIIKIEKNGNGLIYKNNK